MDLENKFVKAKTNKTFSIEICTTFDEKKDSGNFEEQEFKENTTLEFDVLSVNDETLEVQFGDGSVCFNLPLEYLHIISAE